MIFHCLDISEKGISDAVIVQSPDTDVFILLLYYCNIIKTNLYYDTVSEIIGDWKLRCSKLMVKKCVHHFSVCMLSLAVIPLDHL